MRLIIAVISFTFAFSGYAASVDVKDVDASDETTTIEIHKGKRKSVELPIDKIAPEPSKYEEDSADIQGDPAPLASEARQKWKEACATWKTDTKKEDPTSRSFNCGSPTCSGDAGNKTCVSKATYKHK